MSIISTVKKLFAGEKQLTPITTEVAASSLLSQLASFTNTVANPDLVLKYESGGRGYDLYLEMPAKDPGLASLIESRVRTAASKDWSINPFDESEPAKEQAEFADKMFDQIPDLTNIFQKILMADWLGYSVSELIWEIDLDGTIVLTDIRNRLNKNFAFGQQGQLMRRQSASSYEYIDAEPGKFVVAQYNTIGENPYGTGLARSCYWYWWFKREVMSMWLIGTEKFAAPTLIGKYPAGLSESDKEAFSDALASLMTNTSLAISGDVADIRLLEAVRQSGSPYELIVSYCDDQMARLIVGQTLTSSVGANGGNRALGQVHADVKDDITQGDCETLTTLINNQIIKYIIDFNFGEQIGYPKFVSHYEPAKDLTSMAVWLTQLVAMGLDTIPKNWIHEQFTIPLPVDGEDVLTKPAAPVFPGFGQEPNNATPIDKPVQPDNSDNKETPSEEKQKQQLAVMAHDHECTWTFAEDAEKYLPGLPPISDPLPGAKRAKQPALKITRYQIGSTVKLRSQFENQLRRIYNGFAGALISEFGQDPERMYLVMDDLIANKFAKELAQPLTAATERTIRMAARELAQQLGSKFNDQVFRDISREYLRVHAYDRGVVTDMAKTLRETLSGQIDNVIDQGGELGEMMASLRSQFDTMADYKIKQIAVTETRAAANFAVLEMGKRSGMDLEAYFITDPASCPICQEWASRNPYPLQMAQDMNLPHVNCGDFWCMTRKA
jgi:phage gp29-like protein